MDTINNIPKIIHYCWFGRKPLPQMANKCIASWRKYLPDYEIKEWNEDNFDVNSIPYTREAYEAGKYAFVSDYARFEILYKYGGLYFDTDVEVIKPFDNILERGPFMGCECESNLTVGRPITVAPGLGLAVNLGHSLYRELLDLYTKLHFKNPDGSLNLKTVVEYTTELLYFHGMKNANGIQQVAGIWIYPVDYFCPISVEDAKLRITLNTHSIHHYSQSWQSPARRIGRKIILKLGGVRFKKWLKVLIYKK